MVTSVVLECTSPNEEANDGALRGLVSTCPSVTLEIVDWRGDGPTITLYLWVRNVDYGRFTGAVETEPNLAGVHRLDDHPAGTFVRMDWTVDSPLVACLRSTGGHPHEVVGTSDAWHLSVWFDTADDATAFQRSCHDRGVPITVHEFKSMADELAHDTNSLTTAQREALTLARRHGYYDDPRAITQRELADALDISAPAVSHRLRRGYRALIDDVLLDEPS